MFAEFLATALVTSLFGRAVAADCTISSLSDVANVIKSCTSITINDFTVPAGQTFSMKNLKSGTVVKVAGNVTFGTGVLWATTHARPIGTNITFDGQGNTFNGNGQFYWDGQGGNGGVAKPSKMLVITSSGTFKNLNVLNSPTHAFSVGNKEPLVISNIRLDNSGRQSTDQGLREPSGHNTDAFDVSATGTTITGCTVINQDDCIAINKGSNIVFSNNSCTGGHGISIGSIKTGGVVSNVQILNNQVISNQNGLRIKTYVNATDASVSDVTYSGNTVTGATDYGVIIEQDYTNDGATGTPTNGVIVSNISFKDGMNTVSVGSKAKQVFVLCGSGSCQGTWDWTALKTSGGSKGSINYQAISGDDISGFTL
ncbi:hypothetical protein AURDEDRAFT_132904 [Auricularia subglabra TFB-10046 SS5]|nr:hypothetical protein AURDEDRAFT_132904 [Auricularia subglabra TFB-10046 SS5]